MMSKLRQYFKDERDRSNTLAVQLSVYQVCMEKTRGAMFKEKTIDNGRRTEIDIDKRGFIAGVKVGAVKLSKAFFDDIQSVAYWLNGSIKGCQWSAKSIEPGTNEDPLEAHVAMESLHHIIVIDWNSHFVWLLKSILQQKHDIHRLCNYFTIELDDWKQTGGDFSQKFDWFGAITAHVNFFGEVRNAFEFEEKLNLVTIRAPQGVVSVKDDTNVSLGLAEKSIVFKVFGGRC